MLGFIGTLFRVVIGFLVACLVAGIVQVLFAVTPAELAVAEPDRWNQAVSWALLTATQIAEFAGLFALIAILFSEIASVRSFAYHVLVAIAIAAAGFGLLRMGEAGDGPTIVNSYAMAAYLTTGFVAGFVYWLFAGRRAGRRVESTHVQMEASEPVPARKSPAVPLKTTPLQSTGTVPVTSPPTGAAKSSHASGKPGSSASSAVSGITPIPVKPAAPGRAESLADRLSSKPAGKTGPSS